MSTSIARDGQARGGRARSLITLALAALFTAGILFLMLELSGAFKEKVPAQAPAQAPAASAESGQKATALVKRVVRPRRESAVGTIRAVNEALVASKLLARVEEVRVKAGQDVQKGEVLVLLDSADLKSRLDQAIAAETSAQAKYENAQIELRRAEQLRSRNSISQSELDQAITGTRTAKAELDRTQRTVEEARIVQDFATIRAPMAGRIVDKKVNAGDTVSPGQPLLTMYDPSRMQLIATVRESLAQRLKVGQDIPARLDALGYECLASISEIVPEAAAESRSFQVKVTGPCPPDVYSGMFARIFIPLDDEEVLILPPKAIRHVGQLDEVDVISGSQVSRRSVRLGRTLEEGVEVLSGLRENEQVVLHGEADLSRKEPRDE